MSENKVLSFEEKPSGDGNWINGGFFVCNKDVLELIEGDQTAWEAAPMMKLVEAQNLGFYKHKGFWASVDTIRDKINLEAIWATGTPNGKFGIERLLARKASTYHRSYWFQGVMAFTRYFDAWRFCIWSFA